MNWDDEENVNAAANEPQTNVFEAPADLTPTTPPAAPADFTPTTPPTAPTAARRSPSTTRIPFSITGPPLPSMILAPENAIVFPTAKPG